MAFNENVMVLMAYVLFFGVAFVLPTVRVWRQTGRSPYVLPSGDDAFGFVSRCMKLLMAALLAYTVAQVFLPDVIDSIGLAQSDIRLLLRGAGWGLLVTSLLWTICAQFQMGKSWRIGIDTAEKTRLITFGLFGYSRNPIFLAMRVCLAALVLLQPNVVTITFFVVGDVVMQFQVRLEEEFLRQQHGNDYVAYCRRVRRWL